MSYMASVITKICAVFRQSFYGGIAHWYNVHCLNEIVARCDVLQRLNVVWHPLQFFARYVM